MCLELDIGANTGMVATSGRWRMLYLGRVECLVKRRIQQTLHLACYFKDFPMTQSWADSFTQIQSPTNPKSLGKVGCISISCAWQWCSSPSNWPLSLWWQEPITWDTGPLWHLGCHSLPSPGLPRCTSIHQPKRGGWTGWDMKPDPQIRSQPR